MLDEEELKAIIAQQFKQIKKQDKKLRHAVQVAATLKQRATDTTDLYNDLREKWMLQEGGKGGGSEHSDSMTPMNNWNAKKRGHLNAKPLMIVQEDSSTILFEAIIGISRGLIGCVFLWCRQRPGDPKLDEDHHQLHC